MDDSEKALKLQEILQKFIDNVDQKRNAEDPGGNGLTAEFRTLRELGMKMREENTHPCETGKKSYNIRKNRFKDILPFDETRVTLEEIPDEEGSDYINANFILDIYGNNGYIASQGPVKATINDFWRMLWQYEVKVVAMACRLVEMGRKKCEQYWPEEDEKTLEYGDITVTLESEEDLAEHCTVRKLTAQKDGKSRVLTQFHYTGWPDHDIPTDFDVVLEMIAQMRKIRSSDPRKAPMVVHCSAGCGRTGTICAIDFAWDSLKMGKIDASFCLYDIIKDLRDQRQSMIQTPEQYEFAHITVQKLFQKHLEMMEDHVYGNIAVGDVNEIENYEARRKDSVLQDDITQTITQLYEPVFPSKLPDPLVPIKVQPKEPEKVVQLPEPSPSLKDRMAFFTVEKIENIPNQAAIERTTSEKKHSPERPKIETKKPSIKKDNGHAVVIKQKSLDQQMLGRDNSLKSGGSIKGETPFTHSVIVNKPSSAAQQTPPRKNSLEKGGSVKEHSEQPNLNYTRRESTQVEGKHVTKISVGGGVPNRPPIKTTKSVPMHEREPAPDPQVGRAKTLPTNVIVGANKDQNSTLNSSIGNQQGSVGTSQFYSTVSDTSRETTQVTPQTGLQTEYSYSVVNKGDNRTDINLYSSVDVTKLSRHNQNGNTSVDATYDAVQFDGSNEIPAIPHRGYLEPETEKVQEDSSVKKKNQFGFGNIKNLFTGGKPTMGGGTTDSSDIPGYKIKIGKQPKGPRNQPASWSKK